MISKNREFFSPPYYFFLKETENKYTLYFSVEDTITEARKKDDFISFQKEKEQDVKKYIKNIFKGKKPTNTKKMKDELGELVNADGAIPNSKIPILDPRLHPHKTMDQTVAAARITNDPISRGYRTYYGESVEEIDEIDMSGAFGYEETEDMDGPETFKYYKDELDMDPEEAKDRTEQQGKDPSGQKDKKSPYYKDKNFITRATLSEIQKQKAIKMVEDLLMKNKNSDNSEVGKKETEVSKILKKNISSLKKQAEKEGLSVSDLIKMLKSE
jgi:hypothetical protein